MASVNPDLNAFAKFKPNINPIIVMITGSITEGPASNKNLNISIVFNSPYNNFFKISSNTFSSPIPVNSAIAPITGISTLPPVNFPVVTNKS